MILTQEEYDKRYKYMPLFAVCCRCNCSLVIGDEVIQVNKDMRHADFITCISLLGSELKRIRNILEEHRLG